MKTSPCNVPDDRAVLRSGPSDCSTVLGYDMKRRSFLKLAAGLMAPAIGLPVPSLIPPREPYVLLDRGLNGLVSHLGVLPITDELNMCEGSLLEIGQWDGTGFPCLVRNACRFGGHNPAIWIYDFDLWNFRHDDELREQMGQKRFMAACQYYNSHAALHAVRRFGDDITTVVRHGGGPLRRIFVS